MICTKRLTALAAAFFMQLSRHNSFSCGFKDYLIISMLQYNHNDERSTEMYLNILKKDLKRKKAMNVILLVFIILASMFVASSVNNIISVTSALDDYLEMADAPDYFAATMNKSSIDNFDEIFKNAESINSFGIEEILYMSQLNVLRDGEPLNASSGSQFLQSDKDISMNYFLDDNSILENVKYGEFYMTGYAMKNSGLVPGDKITIEINGVSNEFTLAGGFKDAVLGSEMSSMTRFIISAEEFEAYTSDEMVNRMYGGKFC